VLVCLSAASPTPPAPARHPNSTNHSKSDGI
jgi:hypothetical protein